ncbi:hypothetical protein [Cryobacterium sp. TMT1-66-1]|uniref:hypothetical protein n=1 Tax=Cryobacterium sp. TMT1-66-1 TaxID=1259242 RepID=UPI00106A4F6C|nr:hypothetical protein [Cryobacterium sp. TMT1-66-1]TFD06327.1 hypothetical protein E3T29_10695 [Cryobacterium sp. TMT1-66-1]
MGAFEPTRKERLGDLTMAASCAVGAHPQCITGVAILVELAKLYGIELTPRAVSFAGQSSLTSLASGTFAREHLISHGALPKDYILWGEDAGWPEGSPFIHSGHMVAIDEQSSLLLDPSFEQFVRGGFPNAVIVTPIDPTE